MKNEKTFKAGDKIEVNDKRSGFYGWVGHIDSVLADGEYYCVQFGDVREKVIFSGELLSPAPVFTYDSRRWWRYAKG